MSVRTSIRAVGLTSAFGVVAVLAGCSVATEGTQTEEGTGSTSEAMATVARSTNPAPVATANPPIVVTGLNNLGMGPGSLWSATTGGNSSACSSYPIATPAGKAPAGLDGLGCTTGAEYFYAITGRYVWACPAAAVTPPTVVPAGGYDLVATWDLGPTQIPKESAYLSAGFTLANEAGEAACFGTPAPGYVFVVDEVSTVQIGGGCKGACDR